MFRYSIIHIHAVHQVNKEIVEGRMGCNREQFYQYFDKIFGILFLA